MTTSTEEVITVTARELELLDLARQERVCYSKGRGFFLLLSGADVSTEVQVLRAKKLLRLKEMTSRRRIPPTRLVELTDAGRELLEGTA